MEKWVQNGYCIAHPPDGGPVFLHGALPGEQVRARIVKKRTTHAFAIATEILKPSSERIPDDCVAFPACGGCSFRHLSYPDELKLKRELLGELKMIAPLRDLPGFEIVAAEPDGYRRNVHLQRDGADIGFYGLHSNRLVPLPANGCRQASPRINASIEEYRANGAEGSPFFRDEEGAPDRDMPRDSFAQSNRFLLTPWLDRLRAWLDEPIDTVELFCGTGLIGGFARDRIGRYQGFDADEKALEAARVNFARREFSGDFARADLYNRPPHWKAGRVIANPPRAGLGRDLVHRISGAGAREVLYSSCNPHTLNRDLAELERLGYAARRAVAFDFFPRTPHLEIVVQCTRDSNKSPSQNLF